MNFKDFVFFVVVVDVVIEAVVHQSNRFTCPTINIKNGKLRKRQRGRFVRYTCNQGYLLAGERHSTCVRGKWDPPAPKCVRATCAKKPKPPPNGLIYPTHSGAALHFFCRAGYVLRGPASVYCDGNNWDNNSPICLANGEKPKLGCDFEDEDICGWSHDLNHDFDWRREKYGTPSGSIGTGPSYDHTLGKGNGGHYMYIESSSRNENDTARLISPVFDAIDSEVCLEFFYHMFGATIGNLRVYIKKNLDPWIFNPKRAIFSKSGNQGDKWYRSFHSLGIMDEDFQIIIEGVRGSGYVSDIAIDDVRLIVNCTGEPDITTTEISRTEIFPLVDSCENRCGLSEGISNDSFHLTCDCDEDCYENNRCCPDFFDFCVIASTPASSEDFSTTNWSNNIVIDRLPPKNVSLLPTDNKPSTISGIPRNNDDISVTSVATDTHRNDSIIAKMTTLNTPTTTTTATTQSSKIYMTTSWSTIGTEVTIPRIFTNSRSTPTGYTSKTITVPKIYTKSTPTTPKTIRKPQTTPRKIKLTTATTPKNTYKVTTPNLNINSLTTTRKLIVPTIYIKTPPTTPKIIKKTVIYPLKPLLTSTTTTKTLYPIVKPSFPAKESEYNDVIEVSIPKDNDDTLLLTSPFPEEDYSKEFWSDEMDNSFDMSAGKNVRETLKLLTEKEPDISDNNVMAIVVSSVGSIIFVVAGGVLLVRYYRYRYPRRRTIFSSGVSQSDVRFFSNDENLDFTLDNDLYGTI